MRKTPYVQDILAQPSALSDALKQGLPDGADEFLSGVVRGADRVILTAMGASLFACYPTFLRLAQAGLPVWWVETGELIHQSQALVTDDSVVWVVSQSGRSVEASALLELLASRRTPTVGVTNDLSSPVGSGADFVLPLNSGDEHAVSTRSYVNTLAVLELATGAVLRTDGEAVLDAPAALERYLGDIGARCEELRVQLEHVDRLIVVARGASYATAATAALVLKEAAKVPAEGMTSGQFRHGPLELADSRLTVAIVAGSLHTRELNVRLAADVIDFGGRVLWVGSEPPIGSSAVPIPEVDRQILPIAEILPFQLASLVLAERNGVEAGTFRHMGKVTLVE